MINVIWIQVRVVILADEPLDDIFVHDLDHSHDESHILMDDLGLKRVRAAAAGFVCQKHWLFIQVAESPLAPHFAFLLYYFVFSLTPNRNIKHALQPKQ